MQQYTRPLQHHKNPSNAHKSIMPRSYSDTTPDERRKKKAQNALYKAYIGLDNNERRTLQKLHCRSQRAEGRYKMFKDIQTKLEKAMRALYEYENDQEALKTVIHKFENAQALAGRDIEDNFGTRARQDKNRQEVKEDNKLKEYIEGARSLLKKKSKDGLREFISHWEITSSKQKLIFDAYDMNEEQYFSDLACEVCYRGLLDIGYHDDLDRYLKELQTEMKRVERTRLEVDKLDKEIRKRVRHAQSQMDRQVSEMNRFLEKHKLSPQR